MKRNSTLFYSLSNVYPSENFFFNLDDLYGSEMDELEKQLNGYELNVSERALQKVFEYAHRLSND